MFQTEPMTSTKNIFIYFGILVTLASGSTFAQVNSPPKTQYLKLQVAREKLNQTWTILGRLQGSQIFFVDENFQIRVVELQKAAVSDPNQPTEVEAKPTDLNAPSLNFIMKESQTKQCESLREFKTFLNQLKVFKGLFTELEITAASRDQAPCVTKMAEQIISRQFKVTVAFGSLPQGGIHVRAYLDSRGQAITFDDINFNGIRITANVGYGRKALVPISRSGYFVLSFDDPPPPVTLTFEKEGKVFHEEQLAKLPKWTLGESTVEIFGANGGAVQRGMMDSFIVEDIPAEVLERALKERLAYQNKYRWSVSEKVLLRTITGSGLAKSSFQNIVPISLDARYSVTDRFNLKVDLTPELYLGDKLSPKTNQLAAGLLYWIFGHENRHYGERARFRYGFGMQGYYMQNRSQTATHESAYLLTDLMGVAFINRFSYQPTSKWSFNIGADLIPFPASQVNRATLSTRLMSELEYCWTFDSCLAGGFQKESFSLDYIDIGKLTFETQDWTVGYKMAFE